MPFTNAQLDSDLSVIIDDLPVTITIGGDDYSGTKMSLSRASLLQDEGLRQEYRFSVYLRATDVGALPALRSTLTIDGTVYRILDADVSDADRLYRLDLGEQYAKR